MGSFSCASATIISLMEDDAKPSICHDWVCWVHRNSRCVLPLVQPNHLYPLYHGGYFGYAAQSTLALGTFVIVIWRIGTY